MVERGSVQSTVGEVGAEGLRSSLAGADRSATTRRLWIAGAIILGMALVITAIGFDAYRNGDIRFRSTNESGVASYSKGDFDEATVKLEEAARLHPKDAGVLRVLGQSYEAEGKLDKAAETYSRSLALEPAHPEILYNLAIIHKAQGKLARAVAELEKAVRMKGEFAGARLALADLYAATGQKAKARAQYMWVLRKKPFGVDLGDVRKRMRGLG